MWKVHFCLLVVLPAVFAALPEGWKACSRSSKDRDNCLVKEVANAISTLMNGNKKLGVLPVDPLKISEIDIPKREGPVSLGIKLEDVSVTGFKDLKITSIKHHDWMKTEVEAFIPTFTVTGNYKMDGKALLLSLNGVGKCNLTFVDLDFKINIDWKTINKGGKKYFQVDKCTVELLPKKFIAHYENLFNGNKQLGDTGNAFLNENWQEILNEMKGPISQTLSKVFMHLSNNILSRIPADEIDLK